MGLFFEKKSTSSNSKICPLCGKKAGIMQNLVIADGILCLDCMNKCAQDVFDADYKKIAVSLNSAEFENHINYMETENKKNLKIFNLSSNSIKGVLCLDMDNKLFYFPTKGKGEPYIFHFSALKGYELIEDGTSVTKGGLGSAIIGGALFGGFGMVTGSILGKKQKNLITSMCISVSLDDKIFPAKNIILLSAETKKDGFVHNAAKITSNVVMECFDAILRYNEQDIQLKNEPQSFSAADEIKKFKELLDAGIITEDEFTAKKKQLLDL